MHEFDAGANASSEATPRGTLERGIIVEELKLVYIPVSKAACTSLRWLLADLIGLSPESFEDPAKFRITQGQTIQNIHKWPSRYIVQEADPAWLEEVAADESWLRFSVVRDPARRLWSAWQSKLLLRQPEFVRVFGNEPWFPGVPSSPEELLEGYGRFVAALGQDEDLRPRNPHWLPQTEVLGDTGPKLNHVGRTEKMSETLSLLGEHMARFGKELPPMRRENLSPLPYPEGLLTEETVGIIRDYYASDYRAFGYAEPEAATASAEEARRWEERARLLIGPTQIVISRNERLATLNRSLQSTRHRFVKARRNNHALRQQQAGRDREIARLGDEVKAFRRDLRIERKSSRKLEEALREMEESTSWRLTAPLRALIGTAKRARERLRRGGKPKPRT